jgi:hypothetical protein
MSIKLTWALLSVASLGCASSEDRQDRVARKLAAAQIVVAKTEPGSACTLIGTQEGKDPKMYAPFANLGANSEGAMENLRAKALDRGANYIVLDFMMGPMANGRLYACPPGNIPDAAAPPGARQQAPASACKPDCSPGFACVDAQCVSACNPACKAGKTCGADRACH